MAGDAGLCFEYQSDAFGSTHQRAHRSESGGGGGCGGGGSGRVFTEPRAGNFGAQPRLKSRDASRRSTMVAESSFATRLPVADGFKAIGGSARGRTPVDRRGAARAQWQSGEQSLSTGNSKFASSCARTPVINGNPVSWPD